MFSLDTVACGQPKTGFETSNSPYGCGEDSFFIDRTNNVCGIADGVGGWNNFGVDPSKMSRQLMAAANNISKQNSLCSPQTIMSKAYDKVVFDGNIDAGSTTCCIIKLDKYEGILRTTNIGDSGYIIIRNNELMSASYQGRVGDCPHQLSIVTGEFLKLKTIHTPPHKADVFKHALEPGDLIILATDGLWDNIPDKTIILNAVNGTDYRLLPQRLIELATRYYIKPDDITIVVSKVFYDKKS